MLSKLLKRDLKKIAEEEEILKKGLKKELIERLAKKLDIEKVRDYYSSILREKKKFTILEHELVPPHRILSKKEKERVFKKYGLKSPNQLPRIFASDPVAVAIGATIGDVIEIERDSPVAGKIKYYRFVVKEK